VRTFDPTLLNEIANMPLIRPMLGGEGEIDLTRHITDPTNYAFVHEDGGFFVHRKMQGLYEIHTIFRPCDFRKVIDLAYRAQDFMFSATDCTELVAIVPDANRPAAVLAQKGHFVKRDRIEEWKPGMGADVMSFPIDSWTKVCFGTPQLGRAFYNQLEQAKEARGKRFSYLKDEELHHRMLGIVLHLAMAGNVAKGVDIYNRWSLSRGGPSFAMYSHQPAVIDIIDGIIGLEDGEWRLMLCR
jgi:hypothetical protein